MLKKVGMATEDIVEQFIKEGKIRKPSSDQRKREAKTFCKKIATKVTGQKDRLNVMKRNESSMDVACENMDLPFVK